LSRILTAVPGASALDGVFTPVSLGGVFFERVCGRLLPERLDGLLPEDAPPSSEDEFLVRALLVEVRFVFDAEWASFSVDFFREAFASTPEREDFLRSDRFASDVPGRVLWRVSFFKMRFEFERGKRRSCYRAPSGASRWYEKGTARELLRLLLAVRADEIEISRIFVV